MKRTQIASTDPNALEVWGRALLDDAMRMQPYERSPLLCQMTGALPGEVPHWTELDLLQCTVLPFRDWREVAW